MTSYNTYYTTSTSSYAPNNQQTLYNVGLSSSTANASCVINVRASKEPFNLANLDNFYRCQRNPLFEGSLGVYHNVSLSSASNISLTYWDADQSQWLKINN